MNGFATIAALWRELGPLRFLLFATVVAVIVAGFGWLHHSLTTATGWPEAYGFTCHGRACGLDAFWHSGKLLRGGSGAELSLFALIWVIPVTAITLGMRAVAKRAIARRRTRIRPMRPD